MTKSPRHIKAGNVDLKGKKSHVMNCGCCVCIDLRDKNLNKVLEKEIREVYADLYEVEMMKGENMKEKFF